jgi:hypothetical protein
MHVSDKLVAFKDNVVRKGVIGNYSIVGIIVVVLAVIGLLYLLNRA